MILQLFISGELKGQMTFPDFRMDGFGREKYFLHRQILLAGYVTRLKKKYLVGKLRNSPFEVFATLPSRTSHKNANPEAKAQGNLPDRSISGTFVCRESEIGALLGLKSIFLFTERERTK